MPSFQDTKGGATMRESNVRFDSRIVIGSPVTCAVNCSADPGCAVFVHTIREHRCVLKTEILVATKEIGVESYTPCSDKETGGWSVRN